MIGNSVLADTNILLYLLQGDKTLAGILFERQVYLSFITQLELLGYYTLNATDIQKIENLISDCVIIDINTDIKELAIKIKRKYRLKLPDCIIAATSLYLNIPFITADTDFKLIKEIKLILYSV
jgi:predicted nucleic acid-binding protein